MRACRRRRPCTRRPGALGMHRGDHALARRRDRCRDLRRCRARERQHGGHGQQQALPEYAHGTLLLRFAAAPARRRELRQAIAAFRFSSTLSRKPVVESHFWSAPTSSARSFVIKPASTVPTVTFSRVCANFASSELSSSLARCASPRVHAKIEATELVEVCSPL